MARGRTAACLALAYFPILLAEVFTFLIGHRLGAGPGVSGGGFNTCVLVMILLLAAIFAIAFTTV